VSHQSDGRPRVVLVDSHHDTVFLSSSYTGDGSGSVHIRMSTTLESECVAFCFGKHEACQKVPVLSSEGTVCRHCGAQGRTVKLSNAVRLNSKKCRSVAWQITIAPLHLPPLVALTPRSTGASVTQLPSHCCMSVFPVSSLKHSER